MSASDHLIAIELDAKSIGRRSADVEHEREVAIFDILEQNQFQLDGHDAGPYRLDLSMVEDRLVFAISSGAAPPAAASAAAASAAHAALATFILSLSPFRRIVRDYFTVCDTYYQAIRTAPASRIQAIDMGRRALHDEGAKLLIERLQGKITLDSDTARRLFTLVCALRWKG